MEQILDLHIHSKYSRACSPQLTLENIAQTCEIKGVHIIGTGDFTHPKWFSEIKKNLTPCPSSKKDSTLYCLKNKAKLANQTKFILSTEISLIYKENEKVRKIHLILHAPNIKSVEKLNKYLDKNYNIRSDGRPILGMSAPNLVKLCLGIHPQFLIYPAHIWTPWFAVFGSKSGFDSLKNCFQDTVKNIYAYETGLSSDPEMNWRLSQLNNLTLLSNSDAHSLINIGREANIMELEKVDYNEIYQIIKKGNKNTSRKSYLKSTIEFYPEEGIYHWDGHRDCGVSFSPTETKKHQGICPKCHKKLTIGVSYRVDELADQKSNFKPKNAKTFTKLIELDKIIAEAIGIKSRQAKSVQKEYNNLINTIGNELFILRKANLNEIKKASSQRIAQGIKKMRSGKLTIEPGFDGKYGKIKIF